jgi:hypothetical protein
LFNFITEVEEAVADLDFTLSLRDHFVKIVEEEVGWFENYGGNTYDSD